MDMNNIQGFATPSDQAVTNTDSGIPRMTIDPVSKPDLEASPPPNKLQDSFLPRSDLDFDGDEEFERYELADEMRSIGLEPFPKLGADARGVTLGNMSAGASSGSVGNDMLKAGYKGLEQGGAEMFDSAAFIAGAPVELAKNVMNVGLEAVGMEPVKNAFGDIESMKRMVRGYQSFVNDLIPTPDAVVEWSNQPYNNEMLGELIEGVTQFSVAAFPAAKMVKAMTTYNPVARGMIWGAIADFTAFNPDDPTITNVITEHLEMAPPEERDAVLQAFMSQIEKYDTDGELTKRAKTALEGGIIGGVVESAIKTARLIPFDQIIDGTKRAIGRAGDAADARIAERQTDTSVTLGAGVDPMPMIDGAISAAGRAVRPAKNVDEARAAFETSPNDPALRQQYLDLRRARDAELSQMPVSEQLELDTSYRMQHQPRGPQDGGGRLDDITAGGELFPDDVYSANGLRFYGNPNNSFDRQSHAAILAARGNPEAEITIYRAVPTNVDQINTGDWVTLSPDYAAMHAGNGYGSNGDQAGKVISIKVKVKDVFSDGNDLNEFGYFPEDLTELGVKKVVPPKETDPGIIAFHGSGADFDEFRLEMIGTGEGAQAYGYGLYFTQSEDIAKFYRDGVAFAQTLRGKSKINYKGKPFEDLGDTAAAEAAPPSYNAIMSIASQMQKLTGSFSNLYSDPIRRAKTAKLRVLKQLDADIEKYTKASEVPGAEGIVIGPNGPTLENLLVQDLKQQKQAVLDIDANEIELQLGKMYKVGLAPKPDELLDYDLPLSQQPKAVQEKTKGILKLLYPSVENPALSMKGVDLIKQLEQRVDGSIRNQMTQQRFIVDGKLEPELAEKTLDAIDRLVLSKVPQGANLNTQNASKISSEVMQELGIPGIKYRAAGSRATTTVDEAAERNYVIFDDKMIKILEKYGIVGPMAVTAAGVKSSEDDLIENEA